MNKFAAWVIAKDKKQRSIAKKVCISTSTLHNIIKGNTLPTLKAAHAIEIYTEGEITLYDWLDEQAIKTSVINKKKINKTKRIAKQRNSSSNLKARYSSDQTSFI